MLRLKSTGPDVERLQRRLKDFEPRLPIDGIFGPLTERAVRLAQRRLSVFPDDGIAGPKTLAALDAGERPTGQHRGGRRSRQRARPAADLPGGGHQQTARDVLPSDGCAWGGSGLGERDAAQRPGVTRRRRRVVRISGVCAIARVTAAQTFRARRAPRIRRSPVMLAPRCA